MTSPPVISPNPAPTLSHDLLKIVEAATARTKEGQRIFGPLTKVWDDYMQTDEVRRLPAYLRKPLAALCSEITATANRHFDAYIKGIIPTPPIRTLPALAKGLSSPQAPPTPCPSPDPTAGQKTFAQATALPAQNQPSQTHRQPQPRSTKLAAARPDTRLFVRIGLEHPAREAGAFAVFTSLKAGLGAKAHLLSEVQAVNSGFALCTRSIEALATLEECSAQMAGLIGNCHIERQAIWNTYRLDNVPRTVRIIGGLNRLENSTVTADSVITAIRDSTGQTAIRATETKKSTESGLFSTSWTIHFLAATHKPIPRSLRILGTTASAHSIFLKPKTTQCTRCYLWHNSRSCTRPQRCRLCGSNNHLEGNHSTNCTTEGPHTCPARCLHCGGPHAADNMECPLRPVHGVPKTKSQREAITKAGKSTRARAAAAALCSRTPAPDTPMEEEAVPPSPTPKTPTRPAPIVPPSTTGPPTRFFLAGGQNIFSTPFNV